MHINIYTWFKKNIYIQLFLFFLVLNSTLDGIAVSNEEKTNLRRIAILCFTSLR